MAAIALQDMPFEGRTSAVPWEGPRPSLECKRCGSTLAGRREALRRDSTKGIATVVEIFRCRCGRGRHVKREVPATN